jgi:hypothetical protein
MEFFIAPYGMVVDNDFLERVARIFKASINTQDTMPELHQDFITVDNLTKYVKSIGVDKKAVPSLYEHFKNFAGTGTLSAIRYIPVADTNVPIRVDNVTERVAPDVQRLMREDMGSGNDHDLTAELTRYYITTRDVLANLVYSIKNQLDTVEHLTVQEYLPFPHLTPMENLLAGKQVLPFYFTKLELTRVSNGSYILSCHSDITDGVRLAEAKVYMSLLSLLLEELTDTEVRSYISVSSDTSLSRQVAREFTYWSNLENVDFSDLSKLVIHISTD